MSYLTFKIISIAVMLVILLVVIITKKTAKKQEQEPADNNNAEQQPIVDEYQLRRMSSIGKIRCRIHWFEELLSA